MRKFYSLFIALLAVCGLAQAQVTFDIAANPWNLPLGTGDNPEAGNVTSITQDDVVINLSLNGESGTPPRMWSGPQLRIYANNVIEITANKEIKSVTFTFTLGSPKDADGEAINYLVGPNGEQVITKESCSTSGTSVTFTTAHVKGNIRITKIEVFFDGDDPVDPVDPVDPTETSTIAEIIAAGDAAEATTSATVYAASDNSCLLGDGTGYIFVYNSTSAVGDVVTCTGKVSQYGGCYQFSGATLTKTGTATVTYPTVTEIDGAGLDALIGAPAVTYVKVTGTLSISGNYKNLTVEGATNKGSLQVSTAVLGSAGSGDEIEVTGFFVYKSGSSTLYGNIMPTEVKVVGDTPDPEVPEYTKIADLKTAATATKTDVVYKATDVLVTFVSGNSVYVYDGTDGLLLYGSNSGIKAGDKITADIKGQLYLYNGLTEIATSAYENLTVNSSDNAVEAQSVTVADVNNNPKDYENELITIDALVPAAEALASRNITFTDDSDNELVVRDNFNVLTSVAFDTTTEYTVTGFVAIYSKNETTTVQIYPRTADDVDNGVVEPPYEYVGDGTFENPYTVADVQHLHASGEAPTDPVWVKGTIIGAANGKMSDIVTEGENLQASNIVLAADAAETSSANMIPVQLSYNTPARAGLNLVDNPDNLGKEVLVYGLVQAYFSIAGVKTVTDYSLDGLVTRVNSIEEAAANAAIYTIAGQRLQRINRAGLYIVGGKKVVVK